MQLDLTSVPPRAPQPTALIVNPQTGLIDFTLAGTPIPADCASQQALTPAQCQFDQYLQTLNGFPTVTPASAPATAPLDPATLTLGQNVVVLGAKAAAPATDVEVGFDAASNSITLAPQHGWTLGEFYWVGVRGYASGVQAADQREVVGSPTMSLLKQDTPLTCGATNPSEVDPHCPAFEVVVQGTSPPDAAAAAAQLFELEALRQMYIAGHGFDLMAAAGLSKDQIAVLWGFPIHTNSVPVLAPGAGVAPRVPAAGQILVGVQGPVDPATVSAFVAPATTGPVVVMDLTAAAAGDLAAAFPTVTATYASGAIVIQAGAPFAAGHQIGLFFTNAIHSPDGAPLVASPVTVLLTLTAPLVDGAGHSTVSGVSDADAGTLEAARQALAPLFANPLFAMTGVTRANVVYAFAFVPMVQP
jgi:hypothetical protein